MAMWRAIVARICPRLRPVKSVNERPNCGEKMEIVTVRHLTLVQAEFFIMLTVI